MQNLALKTSKNMYQARIIKFIKSIQSCYLSNFLDDKLLSEQVIGQVVVSLWILVRCYMFKS